jgi:two-component system, cell cycle sensor histidine kinase and response regulator CckA
MVYKSLFFGNLWSPPHLSQEGDMPEEGKPRLSEVLTDVIDVMDIAMWELDLNYRVVSYNRKARQIYGASAKGNFCYNAAAGMDTVCPKCPAEMVYAGQESGRSEHRRRDASGKTIYIDHLATPIRDRDGNLTGALVLIIDITRHKQMEAELKRHRDRLEQMVAERTQALSESKARYQALYETSKRAEEVYRSLLDSSADAIVIYDMEGRPQFVSPAFTKIFGWSYEELAGRRIPFVPESERSATTPYIQALIDHGTPCHGFETQRYTKDGRLLDVSISASRYLDHRGEPAGMLVILRDISERKQLEAQLKHSERMESVGILAGGIAHDFNNLMMGIMGNTSLLRHDMPVNHPYQERLKKIEKLIESGARLTSQLLGYARKGAYEIQSLDMNRVIRDTAETFGRTRKEVVIQLELAGRLPLVAADESQMAQVLLNLFINAADAMPGGGRLHIRTERVRGDGGPSRSFSRGEWIRMAVADTGTGIDAANIDHIFDPFFTTKEMGRGTGLGLASVYGIIKSHGGHIAVASEKDKGTTFNIDLPASDSEAPAASDNPGKIDRGSGTILLVDDEEIVLEVGIQMLQAMGYTVLGAANGTEAIRVFEEKADSIDLVVLDMIMPGIGGGETFDAIREIDPDACVLLSSGYSQDGQAKEILARGCGGFIQKPFRMEDLSAKIKEILA